MCSHLYFIIDLYNVYAPFYSTVGFHVFSSVLYNNNNYYYEHTPYALHNSNTLCITDVAYTILGFAHCG